MDKMKYLQAAYDLAETRNYLNYPEVTEIEDRIPAWFRTLGTETGLLDFKKKFGIEVPLALQEFYQCLPLACFLEASIDGNIFLAEFEDDELPLVVNWASTKHLAFACHGHSGSACAARLVDGVDDPLVYWGFADDEEEFAESRPPLNFSKWIFSSVESYDRQLDFWFDVYKRDYDDGKDLKSLGWVRKMPGLAERLRKANL